MKRTIPRQQSLIVPEIQNPFVHKLHLGIWDKVQITVMSVTVAPLRLLLIGTCLLIAWPLAAIAVACRSEEERKQPLAGWRNSILRPVIVFLSRCVFFVGGFHWISVKGTLAPPQEASIITMAPHSSYFDALPVVFLNLSSTVAKVENGSIPAFGTLLEFTQPVLVNRLDPDSRQNTAKQIKERALAGGIWPQIIIFPEGTCTNRTCLISYKLGAFYPGVPVQPVCLRYKNRLDTLTWTWEGHSAFKLFWLTLCQFNTNMEIEFLPVYKPNEEEQNNPKLFASNVRQVMADVLKVPVTDHTYEDCRLMQKAHKLSLPMSTGLVEFQKLHKKLGINLDQMQEMLQKFSDIDLEGEGHITIEQFSRYLQLPDSPVLKGVFELYDRDGSGKIDFREYVIGLSLISAPVNTDSTISLAFHLFDSSHQGYISREDLQLILHNAFGMTEIDVEYLFNLVDVDRDDKISFDEFKAFAQEKPEYAPLFLAYQQSKEMNTNGNAIIEEEEEPEPNHLKAE